MEEEKKMFEDVEALITDYMEYDKQEIPDEWFDSRTAAQLERMKKEYPEGREGYILQALDDEKRREQRRVLIEELKQVRNATKKEKQKIIYSKAKDFIDSNTEKMNKEISKKLAELEVIKKERNQAIKNKIKICKLKKIVLKQVGENSKVYKAVDEETKEAIQNMKSLNKKYNEKSQELERAKVDLSKFEEKYNGIEFSSEVGLYNLLNIIGIGKEELENRMSDGQVYQNGKKVDDMKQIKKMQEEAIKQQLHEKLETRFREIETGYEDLLLDRYVTAKEASLRKQNIEDIKALLQDLDGKSLLDIYKEHIKFFQNDQKNKKELEDLIKKVEDRKEELAKKSEIKKEETEKVETKTTKIKPEIKKVKDEEVEVIPPKKVLTVDELKKKNSKQISHTKKEESKLDIEDERKPYEKNAIIVEPEYDTISVYIKGEKQPYKAEWIANLIKEGKLAKKDFVKNADNFYKNEIKKADPSILGALEMISKVCPDIEDQIKKLQEEYVQQFVEKTDDIFSIKYIFAGQDRIDYKDKTFKQIRKMAKQSEKIGVAEVEGLEERGIWARIKQRFNIKRIESAKEKEITQSNKSEKEQFFEKIQKDAPTEKQQAQNANEFNKNEKIQKRQRITRTDLENTMLK